MLYNCDSISFTPAHSYWSFMAKRKSEKPEAVKTGGKPTISDVAKLSGVSVATVSYVLNNRASEVSRATADRVLKAIQEVGYVKNLAAAALSGQMTQLIAVIIPGLYEHDVGADDHGINPFYGEFIFRLEHEARAHGYALCVHGGREKDYVRFLLQRGVDTAVLVGVSGAGLPTVLDRENIHCILYDSFGENIRHSLVRTNEVKGGYLAAERLIDLRRRRIVFAGNMETGLVNDINSMRYRGALKACEMAEVPPIEAIEVKPSFEDGFRAAEQIIEMKADGVVAPADIIAAGVIDSLLTKGIRVPEDVAVVGYDNLPIATLVRPRLTTIDQGLGDKVKAVVAMIRSRDKGQIKIMDPHVVIRESA
jgi:DNA-binding LacI/PurR family transcriptional regulator